jgi:uncharacterized membrane protein YfcA
MSFDFLNFGYFALDWSYLSYAALGALLVGLSKGGLPSTGTLAVPILSLVISPIKAATLLLPIYVISDVVGVWLYRKNFSTWNIKVLIPAGVMGVFVGWLTATVIPESMVTFLIGLIGVVFCLNAWLRKGPVEAVSQPGLISGLFWGTLSGFTSFISHAGAPPFQVYVLPQKLPKAEFAGTATLVFAVINLAKIWPYQDLRPYSSADLMDALVLIPFAIAGTYLGAYLTKRIPDALFFKLVQIGLFAISLKLIWSVVR